MIYMFLIRTWRHRCLITISCSIPFSVPKVSYFSHTPSETRWHDPVPFREWWCCCHFSLNPATCAVLYVSVRLVVDLLLDIYVYIFSLRLFVYLSGPIPVSPLGKHCCFGRLDHNPKDLLRQNPDTMEKSCIKVTTRRSHVTSGRIRERTDNKKYWKVAAATTTHQTK